MLSMHAMKMQTKVHIYKTNGHDHLHNACLITGHYPYHVFLAKKGSVHKPSWLDKYHVHKPNGLDK